MVYISAACSRDSCSQELLYIRARRYTDFATTSVAAPHKQSRLDDDAMLISSVLNIRLLRCGVCFAV